MFIWVFAILLDYSEGPEDFAAATPALLAAKASGALIFFPKYFWCLCMLEYFSLEKACVDCSSIAMQDLFRIFLLLCV